MTTTTGLGVHDQNLEKQIEKHMGSCMAGFFNLFDRSHRLYPKRLPPSLPSSEPVSSVGSPALSREFEKHPPELRPPTVDTAPKSPVTVSTFEFNKEGVKSPWKFNREAPRLSLDSRINTGGGATAGDDVERDNQRRSPSVIARLMGLEPLPTSSGGTSEAEKTAELRRSASESRSRDCHYRFIDTPTFLSPTTGRIEAMTGERKWDQSAANRNPNNNILVKNNNSKAKNQNQNQNQINQRKLIDFFPPELPAKPHQAVTIYGEIERRLRMRGIDEPSKDLETLKNILEALQLKGLLHSSSSAKTCHNIVFDEESPSPIVLMKPAISPPPAPANRRRFNVSSGEQSVSPRRERSARSPPGRSDHRSSSPPVVRRKGGPLSVETQRRGSETTAGRGSHSLSLSTVKSPKTTRRSDRTVNKSPRNNRRSTAEIRQGEREDESCNVSESSFITTSSRTDNERWRVEEYREGRKLLDRCDKLLHNIAEMNANSNSVELQQPSPVSVLDSSFYKDDESSPSPVKKRNIDFKDQVLMELEDELWSPPSSSIQLLKPDQDIDSSDGSDFSYISYVLKASNCLPENPNLFLFLEKQSSIRVKDKSKHSILQRKLIFDTITEIIDRNRNLPPWKSVSGRPTLEEIWSEFQKIREQGPSSEDLFEIICCVLKKDFAGDSINGWIDCPVEISEAVLDIERLIFKDLVGETIRDLAGKSLGAQGLCRKLVF